MQHLGTYQIRQWHPAGYFASWVPLPPYPPPAPRVSLSTCAWRWDALVCVAVGVSRATVGWAWAERMGSGTRNDPTVTE